MREFFESGLVQRWLWLCPALCIAVAAAVLVVLGVSWHTALLAALLLLACPTLVLWSAVVLAREARRRRPSAGKEHSGP